MKFESQTAKHVFLVALPTGLVVGAAIAFYDYLVNTLLWETFTHHLSPLELSFLPIAAMMLTGLILKLFKVKSSAMADEVVEAYHSPEVGMHYQTALPKLAASVTTMGFGASAGMEGASKWLGATIAGAIQSLINRTPILKSLHGKIEVTLLAGASAGIAAIFRAPLTGAIMGLESPYKKDLAHNTLIHALVASAMSYTTFTFLRNARPYFPILFTYHLQVRDLIFAVLVGVICGLSSRIFLSVLQTIKRELNKNKISYFVKYLTGGLLLTGIALFSLSILGEPLTLQAGLPVANRLLNGQFSTSQTILIFVLKLLATAITFGFGGVGGLFVPSATIGAAAGAFCDLVFHPSQPGLFTLVGIAAFTGASYNSLLFSAVFVAEATGSPMLVVPSLLASSAAFLISAGISNSNTQLTSRKES